MARVVHRRSGPPYLLIVFVLLFVVSTALMVLMNIKKDEAVKELTQQQALLKAAEEAKSKCQNETKDLIARLVSNREKPLEECLAAADAAEKVVGDGRGLAVVIPALNEQLAQEREHAKALNAQIGSLQTELLNKDKTVRDLQEKYQKDLAERDEKLQKRDAGFQQLQTGHQAALAKAQEEWNGIRAELDKNLSIKTQKIEELLRDVHLRENQVIRLLNMIKDLKGPKSDIPLITADGRILRVQDADNVCYIDLGAKDRVVAGLTFSVYPQSGIPADGKGKATIEVTTPSANTSECRITNREKGDPIVKDDLIANVAFDSLRTYTFVVEGHFDLYGIGKPSLAGTEEVKTLIKRFGGNLAQDVDVNTDYVVMGEELISPARPAEDAPPQVQKAWREQMELYERYRTVKVMAQSMGIPVLNTNRFLAFVGYSPTRLAKK